MGRCRRHKLLPITQTQCTLSIRRKRTKLSTLMLTWAAVGNDLWGCWFIFIRDFLFGLPYRLGRPQKMPLLFVIRWSNLFLLPLNKRITRYFLISFKVLNTILNNLLIWENEQVTVMNSYICLILSLHYRNFLEYLRTI